MSESEPKTDERVPIVQHAHSRVRINTYVQRSLYQQAMEIAREQDETMTYVVREALRRFIKDYKSGKEDENL